MRIATSALFVVLAGALAAPSCSNVDANGAVSVTQVVGPAGGILTNDAVSLVVPPGALEQDVTLSVTRTTDAPPSNTSALSALYRFEPEGQTFKVPITASIKFQGNAKKAALFWSKGGGSKEFDHGGIVSGDNVIGATMHFSDAFAGEADGAMAVVLASSGRERETILSGRRPDSLAIDATNVYWMDDYHREVYSVPKLGGAKTTLATTQGYGPLTVSGGAVYWMEGGSGAVKSVPIGGGAVTTVYAGGGDSAFRLVADGSNLYFSSAGNSTRNTPRGVKKLSMGGGTPVVLADAESAIDVFGGGVQYQKGNKLYDQPVSGGAAVSFPLDYTATAFRVDTSDAYVAGSSGGSTGGGSDRIVRAPRSGAAQKELAVGQQAAEALAIDETDVYWTTWKEVMRASKAGSETASRLLWGVPFPNSIALDLSHIYFLTGDGSVVKLEKVAGDPDPLSSPIATTIATGESSAYAVLVDGTVRAWGKNDVGQLGDGTTTVRTSAVTVAGFTDAKTIYAPSVGGHVLAAKTDGSTWAWGYNAAGQLGDGSKTTRLAPVLVSGMTGAVAFAAGEQFSIALKNDGTVWGWGYNERGHLGNGTAVSPQLTPTPTSGLSGVTAIAAGTAHGMAVKSDGTLWVWGYNGEGQLGLGEGVGDKLTPVQLTSLTDVKAIAGGYNHALAVKKDGTVWAWGANVTGQLGTGTTSARSYAPLQITGLAGVVGVSASYGHSLAVKSDGTVWAWGSNGSSELGDGTTTTHPAPAQVAGITDAVAVSAGGGYSLARKSDGSVWGWGTAGALSGTTASGAKPKRISY